MKITAKQARYIKLGESGRWESLCLEDGTLRLGYYEVPHELGLEGDKEGIKAIYADTKKGVASGYATQFLNFYNKDPDTIWITFHAGYLYWCQARPEIEFLGSDKEQFKEGSRLRRTLKGWSNKSISGKPLEIKNLSGDLTKVAAYQQTICSIKDNAFSYLIRKINDEEIPIVTKTREVQSDLISQTIGLVQLLGAFDFELLVDLIFNRSGWQRVSPLGKTQKSIDLDMVLPITGERALVQVKSKTNQAELENYLEQFESWGPVRVFFAYHTSKTTLTADKSNITLLGPKEISEQVLNAGLLNWVMEKVS